MFSGGGDAGIGEAGNDHVNVRAAGIVAVLGVVVAALHVFHVGRDGDGATEVGTVAGDRFEFGERVEGDVYFAGRAAEFVAADAFEKISGSSGRLQEFFEGEIAGRRWKKLRWR